MRTRTGISIDADRARRALDVLRDRIHAEHEGAQLYVSVGGETVIDDAVGNASEGIPLTADHVMLWFSSSKPLTAVAVARLWEAGELALDDRVSRFIPEFARGGKEGATIRHILTHAGGFRKVRGAARFVPWEEQVREVCEAEAEWGPGNFAGYHPFSGWVVLGEIVRRIDGRRIDAYLSQEVFGPLGMTSTSLGIPLADQERLGDRIAHVYPKNPEPQYQVGRWNSPQGRESIAPGTAGWGPARDLGRFYECLLRGGEPILRSQTVEAITAAHRVYRMDHTYKLPLPWGLGFMLLGRFKHLPLGCERTFGHVGFSSSVGLADPEIGLAAAVVTNGLPGSPEHHLRLIAVFEEIYAAIDGLPAREQGEPPGTITLGRDA